MLVALLCSLVGCGRSSVDVQLPKDATKPLDTMVVTGDIAVGQVVGVETSDGQRIATVELDGDLADAMLRIGLVAWLQEGPDNEFIELDASEATGEQLPSGTTLIAKRRTSMDQAEQIAKRWAGNGTILVVIIGAVACILLVLAMRMFMKSVGGLILIGFSAIVGVFLAFLLNDVGASALLMWVYPHIGEGGNSLAQQMGLPEGVTSGLADPRVVSFFLIAIVVFVFTAVVLRKATSPRKAAA